MLKLSLNKSTKPVQCSDTGREAEAPAQPEAIASATELGQADALSKIRDTLQKLESDLQGSHPLGANMAFHIQTIHLEMLRAPEITYVLSDEETGILLGAIQKSKNAFLAAAAAPKKTSKKDVSSAFDGLADLDLSTLLP